jgi:methylenetetrahydrofolate reductase (NADPH)
MKLSQKILLNREILNSPFISYEFFPPKTPKSRSNLLQEVENLTQQFSPLFMNVTWGACGSTYDGSLELASWLTKHYSSDVMLHLTLSNLSKNGILSVLLKAQNAGIRNILALRGDPPKDKPQRTIYSEDLKYGRDLVRLIRDYFGDYFEIAVAGYPDKHPEAESLEHEIECLKEKIDAGADFVITQMFYDVDQFFIFVQKCREAGIFVRFYRGFCLFGVMKALKK